MEKLLRYNPLVGDGDSASFKRLCEIMPYGLAVQIEKVNIKISSARLKGNGWKNSYFGSK